MSIQEEQEVYFDHPPTAAELTRLVCQHHDCDDPASPDYVRVLVRPHLHIGIALLWTSLVIAISALAGFGAHLLWHHTLLSILCGVCVTLLALVCFAKRVAIWLVKVYQRFAPDKIRNRCRFEPSCSQYMILALEKYGFLKGLCKGIARLRRCKPPHGGFDNP